MTESTTHECPPNGSSLTPCCGKTPFELPDTDRLTEDRNLVNCPASAGLLKGTETMTTETKTLYAFIEIESWYDDAPGEDTISILGVYDSQEVAVSACNKKSCEPFELQEDQSSGFYDVVEVVDDAEYQAWLTGIDWTGYPESHHCDEKKQWLREKAISTGGIVLVEDDDKSYLLKMRLYD